MKLLPGKINPALLKTFLLYLFVSFIFFLLPAGFLRPVRDAVLYPFGVAQRVVLSVARTVAKVGRLEDLWRADKEAEKLREKVRVLEAELALEHAARTQAEAQLAQVARIPLTLSGTPLMAKVVAFDPAPLRHVALLNQGTRAGVTPRAIVLCDGMIVGRVESVGPFTSRVALTGDPGFRVAVRDVRTHVSGVLEGAGGGRCIVKYIDITADVQPGDRFVTSELDAATPAGLSVAECVKIDDIPGEIFQRVDAAPLFQLRELHDVVILLPPKGISLDDSGRAVHRDEEDEP